MKNASLIIYLLCTLFLSAQPPKRFFTKFGGNGIDIGYSVKQTLDRQYIIAGSTRSFGNGKMDGCLIKYDINGNFLWQKFFGSAEDDDLKGIIKTYDNNIAVVGRNSFYDINGDCFFMKLNNNGDTLFTRFYGD